MTCKLAMRWRAALGSCDRDSRQESRALGVCGDGVSGVGGGSSVGFGVEGLRLLSLACAEPRWRAIDERVGVGGKT